MTNGVPSEQKRIVSKNLPNQSAASNVIKRIIFVLVCGEGEAEGGGGYGAKGEMDQGFLAGAEF